MCSEEMKKQCSFAGYYDICSVCWDVLKHIDRRFVQIPTKFNRRRMDRRLTIIPANFERRKKVPI